MRFNYSILITLLVLSSSFLSMAQEATELSLEQAKQSALENHLSLKNAALDVTYANAQVTEIKSMGLPQINGSSGFSHNFEIATTLLPGEIVGAPGTQVPVQFGVPFSFQAGVQLNQLLFDGTFFLGLKAASEFVKINELLVSKSEIDVKEGVQKTYFMALIAQQNIDQLTTSSTNLKALLNETTKLYEEGYAEKLDVDRLKLATNNLETTIANLKRQAKLAKQMLLNSMGDDINKEVTLTSSLPSADELDYQENIGNDFDVANRIEYQILQQQQDLNELNLRRYKVGYFPSLYGNFSYGTVSFAEKDKLNTLGEQWFPNGAYGVSLSVPIFDGLNKKAKMDQVEVDIAKTDNTMKLLTSGIALEIEQAKSQYATAHDNLKLQEMNIELANEVYKTTVIKFKEGIGSSFEMIDAETEVTNANTNYYNALYEMSVAKTNLDKALGKL